MRLVAVALALIACDAGVPVRHVPRDAKPDAPVDAAGPPEPVRAPVRDDLARYTADMRQGGQLAVAIETSEGTLHCVLFADSRPVTVANFIGLATGKKPWLDPVTGAVQRGKRFYDGLTFHRVIPGFVIQGGDPLGRGTGGPGYQFENEIVKDGVMKAGVLGMANAGPGTNGSQFFVMEEPREDLVPSYTFFGQCNELDLVKRIARVPRDAADRPTTPVVIEHVEVMKGGL